MFTVESFKFHEKNFDFSEEEHFKAEGKVKYIAGNKVFGIWKNGKLHGKCHI